MKNFFVLFEETSSLGGEKSLRQGWGFVYSVVRKKDVSKTLWPSG